MKIITNDMIIEMNDMYSNGKSIKNIAINLDISPYTVKKYIKNLKENKTNITLFNKSLPKFDAKIFRIENWGNLCLLSEDETEEIRKLWEEIEF